MLEKGPATEYTIAEEFQQHIVRTDKLDKVLRIAPIIILLVLFAVFSLAASNFFTITNGLILLTQLAIPLIVAIAATFIIIMGSIDLSVEGVMGLTSALVGLWVLNDKNSMNLGLLGVLLAIFVCGLFGLMTGLIIVKFKVPSFMVTYGIRSVALGFGIMAYQAIAPRIMDDTVRAIALKQYFGLPIFFYIAVAIFIFSLVLQTKTKFGNYLYAIGDNESLAKISGINVDMIKIQAFFLSGLLLGVAGVCLASQMGRGYVGVSQSQLFPALAAVVVGGTSMSGGKGGVVNTLIGTMIITILSNGLVHLGVNAYVKNGMLGIILIIAVALTVSRNSKQTVK